MRSGIHFLIVKMRHANKFRKPEDKEGYGPKQPLQLTIQIVVGQADD
jgi:hypothetical protein